MKRKKFTWGITALLCAMMLYGCGVQAISVDVEICSEYYIASVRNVLDNFSDHYGKSIRIEGLFFEFGESTIYRMVKRQDFSC